jgi:gliding motility-associated-like protein
MLNYCKYLFLFILCQLGLLVHIAAQENNAILCADGMDNDGDGLIDCDDQDCYDLQNEGCRTCFDDGLSFADIVIEYSPNCINILVPDNPDRALGVSDHFQNSNGQFNFVSLGQGGFIKLGFTNNLVVNSGNNDADIWVFEIGQAVEGTQVELEPFDALTTTTLISSGMMDADGDGYYEFGSISGATSSVDIDAFMPGIAAGDLKFRAIKLIDIPDQNCMGITAGADIDAVCALSSIPLEVCGNNIDDDVDGLTDCDDPDLAMECCCLTNKVIDLGADIVLCVGDTAELMANEAFNSYVWSDGSVGPTLAVLNSGTYRLTVTEENNCELIDEIYVFFQPDMTVVKEVSKCPNDEIVIDGLTFSSPGIYFDTIVDPQFSCDSIIEYRVSDWGVNSEFLGVDQTICGQQFAVESIWPRTIWPDGSSSSQFQVNQSGDIMATALDSNGCLLQDTIRIQLINIGDFFVPTAFSPNNDGINDEFKPYFQNNETPAYQLNIFNRWGDLVFGFGGIRPTWNGRVDDREADPGIYVWSLEFSSETCPVSETYKGDVLLMR